MAKRRWLLMTCLLMGCGSSDSSVMPTEPDSRDAGDAETGDGEKEAQCDSSMMPDEDPCVIQDDLAVFVSPQGRDSSGCGTMSKPCASLERGMSEAEAADKRVYACGDDGPYKESLAININLDGLVVLGGFRCADWSYEPKVVQTQILAQAGQRALMVEGVSALEMRDFVFESEDATAAGSSSIAAKVKNAKGVIFKNTTFRSGQGADGRDGEDGQNAEAVPEVGMAQKGQNSECDPPPTPDANGGGVWSTAFACPAGGKTRGGMGGKAVRGYFDGLPGGSGQAGEEDTNVQSLGMGLGGDGGIVDSWNGKAGEDGSPGNHGDNGAAAPAAGELTVTGYTPADGQDGTHGWPGQGGGGGGASWSMTNCVAPTGGAGGLGGCGGFPGTKGGGGGASIALLLWQSSVTLHDCRLLSAEGGKGGKGGNGGASGFGQLGAQGGWAVHSSMHNAGNGGKGGDGGLGGSGSGGTGGPSYALVYQGKPPTEQGMVTLTASAGGAKGLGGQAPGGPAAPDGTEGGSAKRYQVQ
ncbi:MAG: hypothetical protein CSA75_03065 [Sorangium cellulosum]|nr:MAG: hypothetical protein CSA75_03065 [Sorangium cellulosum]